MLPWEAGKNVFQGRKEEGGGSAVSGELKVIKKRLKNGPLGPASRATDDLHKDSSLRWHGR